MTKKYKSNAVVDAKPQSQGNSPGYFVLFDDGYSVWLSEALFDRLFGESEEKS